VLELMLGDDGEQLRTGEQAVLSSCQCVQGGPVHATVTITDPACDACPDILRASVTCS
jgi:hypothetical protein